MGQTNVRRFPRTLAPMPIHARPKSPTLRSALVTAFPDPRKNRWLQFEREFDTDERLRSPVLYALPERLIGLVQRELPQVLEPKDVLFETRLRALGGTGFCNQRAFASEVLDPMHNGELPVDLYGETFQMIVRRGQFGLHDAFAPNQNEVTDEGRNTLRETILKRLAERNCGYAGWLVTNPQFRLEAAELEREWRHWKCLATSLPDSEELQKPAPRVPVSEIGPINNLYGRAKAFLKRWNLAGFDTWDLPVPISTVFLTDDDVPRNELKSSGISIFIPWSTTIDRDLRLEEVVNYHRSRHDLKHLDGWLIPRARMKWGADRTAKMLQLYFYFELALKRRYPERIVGNLEIMDRIFRAYWSVEQQSASLASDAETEKKTRQELNRRLAAVDSRLKANVSAAYMPENDR